VFGLDIVEQRLGSVKGEDVATFRRRIQLVGELCFDAGGFIGERQRLPPFRVDIKEALAVLAGLFFDASKGVAFGLCFDRSDGFAVNKKEVIDFIAIFQKSFANCDSTRSREINRAAIL
jgi:hypothetical protein